VAAAIDDDAHLGKTSIGHRFPLFLALSASADEVVTGVMSFESAAVDGGETPFASGEFRVSPLYHCGVEKFVGWSFEEESIGGFVQGGEVWDRFEFNDAAEVAAVLEEFGYAAIVGLQEFLENQTGEELVLGEFLGAESVGVSRQRVFGCGVRPPAAPSVATCRSCSSSIV
jgi:hypothetical protein